MLSPAPPAAPDATAQIDTNSQIAERLARYGDLLAAEGGDRFRIRAYRAAVEEIMALDRPLSEVFEVGGIDALIALRGIGRGIAAAIVEMLTTGRWRQLEQRVQSLTPERLFATIPGIGPVLASRLVQSLGVDSLPDLEAVLRLGDAEVQGIGARRRAAILAGLAQRLNRVPDGRGRARNAQEAPIPPVDLLLSMDARYRAKAAAGALRLIAPRRFNPAGAAWLPIMHHHADGWEFTALFSNTAHAHELGRTRDWVVIYHRPDGGAEGRATIVTETSGPLKGLRVIRGREDACTQHYAKTPALEQSAGAWRHGGG
ncbi:DNA-binding protein [Roseicyclus sp.]|uniref:DNA-binding protein n=1 Tax=Roseicyclus sp. TaxID=1914329 RepID=UPI003F6D2127